ncbi:NucA/NucB deoxyribonuclease domain-containing protein [Avibacterium paragallinarum]|uniref:Deoxyribonuclease NucA/NucB domain-containing protein n=1 Tax=Avibacterium paragallinarum TaxID=728 RepID=A0A380Z3Y9_AVIPA|nr:NucA/NucB deoxyribonuclease domain-containing protein [Avibacterium paragallinarum]SUV40739.1 Uncharacterised protein [Avibacterium paragallinarum]
MPNSNCPYGAVASGLTAQQTGSRNNTVGILNAASLGGIGKRAVGNNYLSSLDVEHFIQELEKAQKEGRDTKPIIEKYQKISAENRQELLACNGNVLCESGHLYQMNAGAEEVERNLGFFSRMTVPYPNNLNENNRILLSTLVEQENANSFNQLSSGTKIGLSAIELGAAIGGTGLITKDSLGKFKLSNANANSKLPVVGNVTEYGDIKVNGIITVSKAKYPETATHINDAINKGHPNILTIDRKGAAKRRREALSNIPAKKGFDRDEYPPAMFAEGGKNSSIRYISPSDNRGAGSCIGIQCRKFNDGDKIKIEIRE